MNVPVLLSIAALTVASAGLGNGASSSASRCRFSSVEQVFKEHCLGCHSQRGAADALDLTTFDAVMKGGKDGKVVLPGRPGDSPLLQAMKGEPGRSKMPPSGLLSANDVAIVEKWIRQGAKAHP